MNRHSPLSRSAHCAILCIAAVAANAATVVCEPSVETNAQPRSELSVANAAGVWPRKADRLWLELWCADPGEDVVEVRVVGGKGAKGALKGEYAYLCELPEHGRRGITIPLVLVRGSVDAAAVSNIVVKTEDGKARRFGVVRAAILEQGEEPPAVDEAPRRHPRDAAEHTEDFAKFKEECANGDFVIGWATSMENVRPRGGFKWRKPDKVGVRLARGEYESVQILVAPNGHDLKGVQVVVDMDAAFAASNITSSVVGYSETTHPPPYVVRPPKGGKMKRPSCGWYPDPILDFQKSCDVSGDDVQSFWIRVKCPRDQKAGAYEGAFVVSAEGAEPIRIPFLVRVNDFEVGRVSPLPLAVTCVYQSVGALTVDGRTDVAARIATNEYHRAWETREDRYCDFFADYYLTPDTLYMSGDRVPRWNMLKRLRDQGRLGLFNLRYMWYMAPGEKGEEYFRAGILPVLRERYEKAKELGIEKHAYIYGFDELGPNTFVNCARMVAALKREFPGVPVMTTARDNLLGTGNSLLNEVDIHCPATCFWEGLPVRKAQREGRQVWWYFCNNPASPWANATLEGPPMELRSLMGAQTQKFKPDGFLYYSTVSWSSEKPIESGPFTEWNPRSYGFYHGDGQWTCCGGPDLMPLATLRLENFRDGLEDLWYAKLLEKKLREVENSGLKVKSEDGINNLPAQPINFSRRDSWLRRAHEALAVPQGLVRSMADFSTDPAVLYRWRDMMSDLIEEALEK